MRIKTKFFLHNCLFFSTFAPKLQRYAKMADKDSFGADFVVKNENKIHNERSINKKISGNDCRRNTKS